MSLDAGSRLGPYEIIGQIGAGGMGEVYRARDSRLGRDVALKILPAEVANDALRRQRFELEARAVAALNHPNIVAVHDIGVQGGIPFIVSELVDGEPLRAKKYGLRNTLEIATQIASGLVGAHDAGVIHRDLKPDNILLTRERQVKILDFGLAKMRASQTSGATETRTLVTEAGVVMGTVEYMSPEQVRGLDVDHRSDLFSFGLILYELLAGKRPFQRDTKAETMTAILKEDLEGLPETVPAALRQIVGHCLEKDPRDRFQSARDLRFALAALSSQSSAALPAVVTPTAPRASRHMVPALTALGLVGVAVVAAAIWYKNASAFPEWTGTVLAWMDYVQAPRVSPDGAWVAFTGAVDAGNMQVFVMKPDSGNVAMVTHSEGQGYTQGLSWSTDGSKIFFDRWTDVPRGIYSVPMLGGEERLVTEGAAFPEALPDGSLLITRLNPERKFQLMRLWPETGKLRAYPVELNGTFARARGFPDGKEAVVEGTPIGAGKEQGPHLYVVDLDSGHMRRVETGLRDDSRVLALAPTRDGRSVLASILSGNGQQVTLFPRDRRGAIRTYLTLTTTPWTLDAGPDGSIYLDQIDRPTRFLRFSPTGGRVKEIATLPPYPVPGAPANDIGFAILPGGRIAVSLTAGGHTRLVTVKDSGYPVPLVMTAEDTSSPVAAFGGGQIAFLIGAEPRHTIAIASIGNGQIGRRIPFEKGSISALAGTPDGKTLFCAAGGMVWSIPLEGGEPSQVRPGDYVAVDPEGNSLLVEMVENPRIRMIVVPVKGGPEHEIPTRGELRPAAMIGPNAIDSNGRILTPVGAFEGFWPPGILDAKTGEIRRIPVEVNTDFQMMGWGADGSVVALAMDLHSKIWKFQPK